MNSGCLFLDLTFVRPIDVAKLIVEYRKNRVETINIAKNVWYNERSRLQPIYRTNLKLFIQDVQLVLNLFDEPDLSSVIMEIQQTIGKNVRELLDYPADYNSLAEIIQRFKNARLILKYFPGAYMPKFRYSALIKKAYEQYPDAVIIDVIKNSLELYSLVLVGAKNKPLNVESIPLRYGGIVRCDLYKNTSATVEDEPLDIDISGFKKVLGIDITNFNDLELKALFR